MADRPTRIEVNCETGETIVHELTDAEIAEVEAAKAAFDAEQAKADAETKARAKARQALLDRLGLTADEAALLLG